MNRHDAPRREGPVIPSKLFRKLAGPASATAKLLRLIAASGKFDLFLTVDKRLPQQNKTKSLPFAIVLLRTKSNRTIHVFPFAPETLRRLVEFQPGRVYALTQPD